MLGGGGSRDGEGRAGERRGKTLSTLLGGSWRVVVGCFACLPFAGKGKNVENLEKEISVTHIMLLSPKGLVALPVPHPFALEWWGGGSGVEVGADSPLVFWSLELPLVGDWKAGAQPLCWGRLSWG